jgi:cell division initiation protein
MRYTPVELRHVRISRGFFGYRRDETNRMLEDVADSFEEVWSERGELVDKLHETEQQLTDFKEREVLLANTLISAEKAGNEAKELARREAELILSEAHHEARSITRTALAQREHLFAEARRVETLLRSALGMVEVSEAEPEAAEGEAGAEGPDEHWPKREDTREFQLPLARSAAEVQAEAAEHPEPADDTSPREEENDKPLPPPLPPAAEEAEVDGPWAGRDFAWG